MSSETTHGHGKVRFSEDGDYLVRSKRKPRDTCIEQLDFFKTGTVWDEWKLQTPSLTSKGTILAFSKNQMSHVIHLGYICY